MEFEPRSERNEEIRHYLIARATHIYDVKILGPDAVLVDESSMSSNGMIAATYDADRVVTMTFSEAHYRASPEGNVYEPLRYDLQLISRGPANEAVSTYAYRLNGQPSLRIERLTELGPQEVDIAHDPAAEWQIEDMLNVLERS